MGRTGTPEVGAEVVERLHAYALEYRPLFPRSDQFRQGRVYLHGLLLDGERKSIEPLSRRGAGGEEEGLPKVGKQNPRGPAPHPAPPPRPVAAGLAPEDG